ncbi:MAG: 5-formyltetrahydrofolate cyclo-ligase [Pseudomonadota bacterium]
MGTFIPASSIMPLSLDSRNNIRQSIRASMRQQRRNLSPLKQKINANKLAKYLINMRLVKQASKIAVYLSNDGELDLSELIKAFWKANKTCYLPVLNKKLPGHLVFLPYNKNQKLINNRYKILEPAYSYRNSKMAKQLDIILMPLVSFDKRGNRIGMGGGYYDRTLSFMRKTTKSQTANRKPALIGIAHSIQQVEQIPVEPWDIKLNMIVTDNKCFLSESLRENAD